MKPEFFIARRFAFKPRSSSRPTFIVFMSVTGIALGTAALILTLSIVKGFSAQIENKLVGFSSHFQIRQPKGALFMPLPADTIRLATIENIDTVIPFLEKNIVLQSGKDDTGRVKPAMLKGIAGGSPPEFLKESMVDGAWFDDPEPSSFEVLVGKPLAESMDLAVGSRLLVISTSGDSSGNLIRADDDILNLLSSLDLELATVRGIYETGLNEGFDKYMVLADLSSMQKFFNRGRTLISGYEVLVHDLETLRETAESAIGLFGYPFFGYTVYERYANLFEWLKLQQNITPLLIITITVVAVFNIISTLLVLIIEKTREIGMLSALGLPPAKISKVFLSQAFLIALVGIALGNLLAFGFSAFELHFQLIQLPRKTYFIEHVPIQFDVFDYLTVSCLVALLTMAFAFVPARVAASLKPGTALLT